MKTQHITLLLAVVFMASSCATYYTKKADKEFDNLMLVSASNHYNKALKRDPNNTLRLKLANTYRMMNKYGMALAMYDQVSEQLPVYECINMYYYGKILMNSKRYDEADKWFSEYLAICPYDQVAVNLLKSCRSVNNFKRDTSLFTVQAIHFPGLTNYFGAVNYQNGIIFTGEPEVGLYDKKSHWTGNGYLNLYSVSKDSPDSWSYPQPLKGDVNGQYHEGVACFSADGNKIYFTRNNYYHYKLNKNAKNENNLKIFTADLVGDEWINLTEFPFNSDDYSVGHPALSEDGNRLYFVSDLPGGFGGTDLYYSDAVDGEWTAPVNLGDNVNTSENEMFPYMHKDGKLYFSSAAHANLGGLDVFVTSQVDDYWAVPTNLNYPVNSSKDDFAFVMSDDDRTGYISSNRSFGDKIFEFKKHDPTLKLIVTVLKRNTHLPFPDANLLLSDETMDDEVFGTTNAKGIGTFTLDVERDYYVLAGKEDFFSKSEDFTTKGQLESRTYRITLELDELVIDKPIVLDHIYYDFDKWFIRDDAKPTLNELVKTLKDNPNISIELSSHTDARASDRYNLILSEKRAKAAVDYIVAHGIDPNRIKSKGYGESHIINHCTNGVFCTDEEHQVNRRTEFKVIKVDDGRLVRQD